MVKSIKSNPKSKKPSSIPATNTNFNPESNPMINARIKTTKILFAPYFTNCVVYYIHYVHKNQLITQTKIERGLSRREKLFPDSAMAVERGSLAWNKPFAPRVQRFNQSPSKVVGPNSYLSVLVQYIILNTLANLLLAIITNLIDIITGIFVNHDRSETNGIKGKKGKRGIKISGNKYKSGIIHGNAIYRQIHITEAKLIETMRIVTNFTITFRITLAINKQHDYTKNKLHDYKKNKLHELVMLAVRPTLTVQTVPTYTWLSLCRLVVWLKGQGDQVRVLQIPRPQVFSPGPPEGQVLDLDVGDLAGRVGDLEGEQVSDLRFPDLELGGLEVGGLEVGSPEGRQEPEVRTESEARSGKTESEADRNPEAGIQLKKKKMKQMGKSPAKLTNKLNQSKQLNIIPNRIATVIKPIIPLTLPKKYLTQEWVFLPWRFGEEAPNQVESAIKVKKREDRPIKFITQITPSLPPMICSVSRHMGYFTWPKLKRPKR